MPYLWYGRETARILWRGYNKLIGDVPWEIFNKITIFDYKEAVTKAFKFLRSENYRTEVARDYIMNRIGRWEYRGQLNHDDANYLRSLLASKATTPYLTDFIALIGLYPIGNVIIPSVSTGLYATGNIDFDTSLLISFLGGSITRTAYTGSRMAFSILNPSKIKRLPSTIMQHIIDAYTVAKTKGINQGIKYTMQKILEIERLIALGVGLIPASGNSAYAVQMGYSASIVDKEIGKFMLYYIFTSFGKNFPIWGGSDTLSEHFTNHIPDVVVKDRG